MTADTTPKAALRFTPDDRLIDLMVGQLFYESVDAVVRELLQNAEDACALQALTHDTYQSSILVRYSTSGNWVEVADNGLGMNEESVRKSFAAVGAPKGNVAHIRELIEGAGDGGKQIANFGIGILSCFGVADEVTVFTKMDGVDGLAFSIPGYHGDFQFRDDAPAERGTRILLNLKPGGPMTAEHISAAVDRHARHAAHVAVENADTGERRTVEESWRGRDLPGVLSVEDPVVSEGYIALDPAWDTPGGGLQAGVTLCNGGFLVRENECELLPPEAIGYVGEIDVKPNALTIKLNREEFVQDVQWQAARKRLAGIYNQLVRARVDEWGEALGSDSRGESRDAIERGVILLTRGPTRAILESALVERLDLLLPSVFTIERRVLGQRKPIGVSIADVVQAASDSGVVYFTRKDEKLKEFQQSVSQGHSTVQVRETVQTEEIRSSHLLAKGFLVVTCRQRMHAVQVAGSQQTVAIDDAEILKQECQKAGIRFVNVNDATLEEVDLAGMPEGAVISTLLGLGEDLKFAVLDGTQERVLRDFTGRLLNCRHPEIRDVIRILPDAIGNPVRREILQIYMDLLSFRINEAQERARALLTMDNLSEMAQLRTGEYLRDFLVEKLQPLLTDPEETQ